MPKNQKIYISKHYYKNFLKSYFKKKYLKACIS